jgi:hypothetical protein
VYNSTTVECFKANYDAEVCLPKMQLGWALFLASSMVNHSCDPNMYQVWYVVVRAKRPILKGEQLTFCYTMPATKFSFEERQVAILNHYKFKCRCDTKKQKKCIEQKIMLVPFK